MAADPTDNSERMAAATQSQAGNIWLSPSKSKCATNLNNTRYETII
jgi:hypothetical protein